MANLLINKSLIKKLPLVLIAFTLVATSCKSKKKLTKAVDNSSVNRESKADVFTAIQNNRFEFEYFSASASCDYSGSPVPLSIDIRMERNKRIWMSIGAVFFEGARVLITEDSVFVINFRDKEVISRKIEYISHYIGTTLTIGQIQDALVGNSILTHDNNSAYENTTEAMKITTRVKQFMLDELFHLEYFRPVQVNADETGTNNTLEVIYSDFSEVDARLVPNKIKVSAVTNMQPQRANLNYSDISTQPITEWPFRIPANYERK